jgi:hypothetical protein
MEITMPGKNAIPLNPNLYTAIHHPIPMRRKINGLGMHPPGLRPVNG